MNFSNTSFFFFFNDPATTEIYTLSLHDALPISPPPGCQDGALLGDIFGLHEELRERRMRRVGCGERERQLAIGRDLDVAHAVAAIRDRYATNLGVILRRNDDLQGRRDHCITAYEFRTILGEGHLVAVGLDAARLIARGPHGAALDVAQEEIAAARSEEHTSELQSRRDLVCRLLLEKKK